MGSAVTGMMRELSNWIVVQPFSIYLQNMHNMIPVVQTLHIFAIAAVLSSAAMIDLRVLGLVSRDRPLPSILRRFEPGIWLGLGALALTGAALIIAEPARSLLALQFQAKMAMVVMGVAVSVALRRMMSGAGSDEKSPIAAKILAVVSLLIWIAVIALGRWIAYA